MMLQTYNIKALGILLSAKKVFICFSYISLCKSCNPQEGATFGPKMGN